MLNGDTVIAVIWMVLLAGTYWLTLDFPPGPAGVPGPAYVPRLLVYTGAALVTLLLWQEVKGKGPRTDWRAFGRERLLQTGAVALLLFAYALLWGRIHWVVLSAGFLFGVGLVLKLRWWVAAVMAGVLSVGLYFLFNGVFHVML